MFILEHMTQTLTAAILQLLGTFCTFSCCINTTLLLFSLFFFFFIIFHFSLQR